MEATAPNNEARQVTAGGIRLIRSCNLIESVIINAHLRPARLKDLLALVIVIPTSLAFWLTFKNGV